ncbi:MAG: hypothetical protein J5794_07545 [Lachnospiraceae bacterium]|nr:hypothetical protein [Lachnospiraceae bacterium]
MAELFEQREIESGDRKKRAALIAAAVVSGLAAAVCIVLCFFVKPGNETLIRILTIGIFTVGGWIGIYLVVNVALYQEQEVKYKLRDLARGKTDTKRPGFFKKVLRQLYLFIPWFFASFLLWSFVLNQVTDTVPAKKIVLFIDAEGADTVGLQEMLSEEKPQGIRMIQVHDFAYASFDESELARADLYIVREGDVLQYLEQFTAVPEALRGLQSQAYYEKEGVPYGILVYDAGTGYGIAGQYIPYVSQISSGEPDTGNYYLFFSANSKHLKEGDDSLKAVIERLFTAGQ